MPDSDWSRELKTAVRAVSEAAAIAHEEFCAGFSDVEEKADLTPVSNADRKAEDQMMRLLNKRFPHDTVIGEETTTGGEPPSGRVWLLDPIDGTSNAITGINPVFMSQVCLLVDGEPVVAALKSPITDQLFTAVKRRGAFLHAAGKKVPLKVSDQTDLEKADVLMGVGTAEEHREWLARVYSKLLKFANPSSPRHFGCSAYDLCLVAAGGLSPRGVDANINCGSQAWDLAPGVLLVRESGGATQDLGREDWHIDSNSLVAGSEGIVQSLLDLLNKGASG